MNAERFSVLDEIQRLQPISLPGDDGSEAPPRRHPWKELTNELTRLARQQAQANVTTEYVADQTREAVEELRSALAGMKEQLDDYRRENTRLNRATDEMARNALAVIDALDDLAVAAQQASDERWQRSLERLTRRLLEIYDAMGLTEIVDAGPEFNPEVHEALDTVERAPGQAPYQIVSTIQRGFRFNGRVLRPIQVITTQA